MRIRLIWALLLSLCVSLGSNLTLSRASGSHSTQTLTIAVDTNKSPMSSSIEAPFLSEIRASMTKMMSAMNGPSTGDVDKDFVSTMVAHHRGAIDMAQAELKYGRNVKLRRIASEIIVTQEQEIAAMRLALREP